MLNFLKRTNFCFEFLPWHSFWDKKKIIVKTSLILRQRERSNKYVFANWTDRTTQPIIIIGFMKSTPLDCFFSLVVGKKYLIRLENYGFQSLENFQVTKRHWRWTNISLFYFQKIQKRFNIKYDMHKSNIYALIWYDMSLD